MALVDVPTLARWLAQDEPLTLIDVRWKLGGPPGRDLYLTGHLPGAVFLDLDTDVTGAPGVGGRHPLPEPAVLQAALQRAGVHGRKRVVVYDDGDGMPAARLWWTLRWAGHPDVAVLDGGLGAWLAAGQPLQAGAVSPEPGDMTVQPGGMPVLDAAGAAELARTGVLLDARAPARYRGEQEPIDPVAGHIPGAVNLPYASLVEESGRLRPLHAWKDALPASIGQEGVLPTIGAYCGSGVTAAHTVLALEAAGLGTASLYVGSWSDWVSDPSRPVATGEQA